MSYSGTHTLGDVIRAHATRTPDARALISPQNPPLTYGQFASEMDAVRATFNGWTIGRGDRVALCVASHAEAIVAYVCVAAAATVVPLTPDLTEVELDSALRRSGAKAVIASEGLEQVCYVARKLDLPLIRLAPKPTVGTGAFHLSGGIPGVAALPGPAAPDDIATVLMSSGTTAEPKLIPLTHALVVHRAEVERDYFQLSQRDVCINFRQPYLAGSLHGGLIPALVTGGTFVVPGNFDPDGILNGLAEFGVTWFTCGTAHLDALLTRAPLHQDAIKGSRLRFIRAAGSHLPGKLLEKVEATFGVICVEAYASTECGTISCTPMPPAQRKPGTVGVPSGCDVAILGDRGERLPAGEDGEIAVRGPKVFAGYDRNDAARTATVLSVGWFRTGDLGRLDEDGHLTIRGRVSDVINRGGQKVSPPEVERALLSHDDVRDCICFPVAHPTLNQIVAAAVVLRPEASFDEAAFRNFLRHRLSQFKIPVRIVRWDEIPRGASGKPLRAKASEMFTRLHPPPSQQAEPLWRDARTPQEEVLCALFAEVLGVARVGIADNFFELNGDSLMAMRLISRIRATLDVEIAIGDLFEAPSVGALAKRLDGAQSARAPLHRVVRPTELPLSFAQRRLWFLNRLEGKSATYTIPIALRLTGELDHAALEAALADVVERHESLRTIFPDTLGVPRQQILEACAAWPRLQLVSATEATLADALASAARRGFDLASEPPLRAHLFVLGESEHVLLLVLHHIACDGRSLTVLRRDLAQAYAARRKGQAPALPALPVQYADYTLWQHALLGDESDGESAIARQLAFWRNTLVGLPEQLDLPSDRPRPAVSSYRGDSVALALTPELHRALLRLARESQASLFMVLQAGLAVLLTRLGAGTDIPIGSPIAGRTDSALDDLVGFFVNTLVLRTDTSGNPSFSELIGRVRAVNLAAYSHQEVPFERLVEVLNPPRSLSHHPLFQVMLAFQNNARPRFEVAGLASRSEAVATASAKFDLSLSLSEERDGTGAPGGIVGVIEYSTDLFERASVEKLAERFIRVIEAAVAAPERALGKIDILGAAERETILRGWNDTAHAIAQASLPELFAAQAAKHPDAVAVTFEEETLSYGELDIRANRLAHHLRALGVGSETVVGLCLARSLDMIVGLIGILKAGGAYLPLDPNYPSERLAFMLADARARVLLTHRATHGTTHEVIHGALMERLPAQDHAPVLPRIVDLDADATAIAAEPASAPLVALEAQHPAYVIYTSGSNGTPKGVVGTHAAMANRIAAQTEIGPFSDDDVCCQKTSIGFVDSIFETLGPLTMGTPLVVVSDAASKDPDKLAATIERAHVTRLITVPSLAVALASEPEMKHRLAKLSTWTLSGEAFGSDLLQRLTDAYPNCRFVNLYGSSEVAADATWHIPLDCDARSVPIGRPFANCRAYVLDCGLQPVPAGVTGELYIAGAGLARGYLGRAGLTGERFVADPYGASGSRMYRTGDLARWRADGVLDFLGRVDAQVKLRGFRIEPGEIEAVLMRHAGVAQAAVIACEDNTGNKRLVGYVIAAPDAVIDSADLRAHLARTLPDYMVLSSFVVLDRLPLTPTGKVDRKALPPPQCGEREQKLILTPARTPTEEVLAGIWENALGLERVGVHDDFFQLGGHSLLAVQVLHEMNSAFGLELPMRLFFAASTVAAHAREIERARAADQRNGTSVGTLVPFRAGGMEPPFFLVAGGFGGEADLLVYARLARFLNRRQPFYGLRTRCVDERVEPPETVEMVAAEHLSDIRKIQPHGPYFIGGACAGGVVALEMAQQLHSRGEVVGALILVDSSVPSWSAHLRYRLFRLWSLGLLPLLQSWRLSRSHFYATLNEKIIILTAPSPEQRVGREKVRIGLKYFRRLMRYSQQLYPGQATLIVPAESKWRDPARMWRDLILGELDVYHVPGDHSTHLREHAVDTAACLDACLEQARDRLRMSQSLKYDPQAPFPGRTSRFSSVPSASGITPS